MPNSPVAQVARLAHVEPWTDLPPQVTASSAGLKTRRSEFAVFDWLRRKPASSQIIEDVVFGKLERAAGRTDLEAEVELAETGEVVTVWVEAAGNPTDAQRNLFLEFCRRYPTLRARLESALRGYRPDYPADMGFVLATLSLSADGKELSLQFTPSVEDGDMAFFVDLREWEILGVQGVD